MKISRLTYSLSVAVVLLLAATAAAADAESDAITHFEKHVRPLLAQHCYACHSQRANLREGGLLLDSRDGWSAGGQRGPAIVPGDAEASLLIRAVRHTEAGLEMPPDKKLSDEEISHLETWIRLGAVDPREESHTGDSNVVDPADPVAGREHWAYRPLARGSLPDVNRGDWPQSAIDHFVLAKLEAQQLRPAPDADRRTLVRRLYFQLIGLAPTPEQVAAFCEDSRPDALERLVDQLLASPQFGELWGRHWLDLARYADSNGLDENFLFREAWRYRNWVIAAVNADMPYDRFLLEQIAGDLLPYDSLAQRDQQRIAAGFLVIGPKVLLGNDPPKQRLEVADEQLDTIGRAILGQTIGCARCHDHKFDPIPTADYYAMAGILTSTRVMERRYMLGEQRVMERLEGLGADGNVLDEAYEEYWRELPRVKQRHAQANTALELLEKDDAIALAAHVQQHRDALADGASNSDVTKDERLGAQRALVAQLEHIIAHPPAIPPRAMVPAEAKEPHDEAIRLAGQFDRPGQPVPRGLLRVLGTVPVEMPAGQSGRVELAHWLTDHSGGAGHLAARVLANRVWHQLIGRGLVRTVDNFGRTGEPPTHPALLDYLADELIRAGWSLKALARQIVLSRTFALSSQHDEACHAIDPDNVWLWRAHRRRLRPEALRDAMLQAAGQLDLKPMDSTVAYLGDQATAVGVNRNRRRTDFPCRSVYLPVIRNDLPEIFDVFDFANPHTTTGARPETSVPTQSLYLLNDLSVMEAATATAGRLLGSHVDPARRVRLEQRIELMYRWIVNDAPTASERRMMMSFVPNMEARLAEHGVVDAALQSWSIACHALFASSRFQILE